MTTLDDVDRMLNEMTATERAVARAISDVLGISSSVFADDWEAAARCCRAARAAVAIAIPSGEQIGVGEASAVSPKQDQEVGDV